MKKFCILIREIRDEKKKERRKERKIESNLIQAERKKGTKKDRK